MYHDVEHEIGCRGRHLAKPDMRDCTCGKIIDCLLAERQALQAAMRVVARELPYLGDGADVGAMEIAVKILDEK